MGNITLREAAHALLDARQSGAAHVGYRGDLWLFLKEALKDADEDTQSRIVAGVAVPALLDQCERLAEPIRASTMSFQYACAIDNCVAVIKALRDRNPTPTPREVALSTSQSDPAPEIAAIREVLPPELLKLTFAIQHNPNCPSPWLVRLPGKSGAIDMKPYGDPLGLVRHQTGDILGFGKTLEEAARAALTPEQGEAK